MSGAGGKEDGKDVGREASTPRQAGLPPPRAPPTGTDFSEELRAARAGHGSRQDASSAPHAESPAPPPGGASATNQEPKRQERRHRGPVDASQGVPAPPESRSPKNWVPGFPRLFRFRFRGRDWSVGSVLGSFGLWSRWRHCFLAIFMLLLAQPPWGKR